jgi:hypothetical protein
MAGVAVHARVAATTEPRQRVKLNTSTTDAGSTISSPNNFSEGFSN